MTCKYIDLTRPIHTMNGHVAKIVGIDSSDGSSYVLRVELDDKAIFSYTIDGRFFNDKASPWDLDQ